MIESAAGVIVSRFGANLCIPHANFAARSHYGRNSSGARGFFGRGTVHNRNQYSARFRMLVRRTPCRAASSRNGDATVLRSSK